MSSFLLPRGYCLVLVPLGLLRGLILDDVHVDDVQDALVLLVLLEFSYSSIRRCPPAQAGGDVLDIHVDPPIPFASVTVVLMLDILFEESAHQQSVHLLLSQCGRLHRLVKT